MLKYILLVSFFLGISSDAQACCPWFRAKEAPIAPEIAGALSPRAQLELGDIITRGKVADAVDRSRLAHHPDYEALRAIEIKNQENLAFAAAITRSGGVPSRKQLAILQLDSAKAADLRARITRDLYPSQRK